MGRRLDGEEEAAVVILDGEEIIIDEVSGEADGVAGGFVAVLLEVLHAVPAQQVDFLTTAVGDVGHVASLEFIIAEV